MKKVVLREYLKSREEKTTFSEVVEKVWKEKGDEFIEHADALLKIANKVVKAKKPKKGE